jgi:hypothetical protein
MGGTAVHTLMFGSKLRKSRLINQRRGRPRWRIIPLAHSAFVVRVALQVSLIRPQVADERSQDAVQPLVVVLEAAIELVRCRMELVG